MIYVLQFSDSLGSPKHQARHYIGYADAGRLNDRIAEHRAGQGAKITRAAVAKGYTLEVVATIPGDRSLERRLKNWKNSRRVIQWIRNQQMMLCPQCRAVVIHADDSLCPACWSALLADSSPALVGLDSTLSAMAHCAKAIEAARAGDYRAYAKLVTSWRAWEPERAWVWLHYAPQAWAMSRPTNQHWRWKELG